MEGRKDGGEVCGGRICHDNLPLSLSPYLLKRMGRCRKSRIRSQHMEGLGIESEAESKTVTYTPVFLSSVRGCAVLFPEVVIHPIQHEIRAASKGRLQA